MNNLTTEEKFDDRQIKLASFLSDRINQREQNNFLARLWKKLYSYLWRFLIKFNLLPNDPIVKRKIGKRHLLMNASHKLPNKMRRLKYYDTALPRIAVFLKQTRGKLIMIDVGANIGDTVSLITDAVDGNFLCIEPSEKYFRLLKINTRNIKNVFYENAAVSDSEDVSEKTLKEIKGTAYLTTNSDAVKSDGISATATIDELIKKYPEFSGTNLLKIDTDGFDIKVLKSATDFLKNFQPILYVEFSPWHLISIGKDNPLNLFEQIKQSGYSNALFYDNHGYPFMCVNLRETEILNQITLYARRKPNLYYDVLAFPDSAKSEFVEFYSHEIARFPDAKYIEF